MCVWFFFCWLFCLTTDWILNCLIWFIICFVWSLCLDGWSITYIACSRSILYFISTYMCVNLYIILCTNLIKHTKKNTENGLPRGLIRWYWDFMYVPVQSIVNSSSYAPLNKKTKKHSYLEKHISFVDLDTISYSIYFLKRSFINIMLLQFLYFPVDFTTKKI